MKQLIALAVSSVLLMAGCNGNKAQGTDSEADSTLADSVTVAEEPQDTTPLPMFLYCLSKDYMMMVYWSDVKEPQKDKDNAEYFDQMHRPWELQEGFRRNAALYTKMLAEDGKTIDIKYIGELLKNPDGEEMYGGELHSRASIPSPGLRYAFVNPNDPQLNKTDWRDMDIVVTENYLQTRKLMKSKLLSPFDKENPLPKAVVKQLEEEYGMKAGSSTAVFSFDDRYTYGVMQFKGVYKTVKEYNQEHKVALALEVLTDGDKVYSYPVEGYYDDQYGPTWNVDDEGHYISCGIPAAFEGPNGPELCFTHWAPESCTVGLFVIRNGKLERIQYECYHSMIDENTPLWKKDLAEMRRLYKAHDPHELKNYSLTRYRTIDIDEDGIEEFWLRDKDDKHGGLFTLKDGKISLIGVEDGRLQTSFRQVRDGKGYVQIGGSAGGPSMYTQIFEIKKSQVVRRFTSLEIYGEIDECSFDGKNATKEEGAAYIKSLPEVRDPYIYFMDINE
jgi:hypothetical protein